MPSSTAIASSSKSRPSVGDQSSEIQTATQPASKTVDSNEDSSSGSEEEDDDDDSESIDSEGDIEAVTPKRKASNPVAGRTPNGKSLPKYAPPEGMIPITVDASFKDSPFEYEKLANNPKLQLWAIRVPLDFKPSRLSSLSLTPPTATRPPSGTLKTKSTTYTLTSAGQPTAAKTVVDEEGRQPTAGASAADTMGLTNETMRAEGGEEMSGGMRLLVPHCKQGGKLFVAPLPVSHHILLTPESAADAVPAVNDSQTLPAFLADPSVDSYVVNVQQPKKRQQPEHLLKFRNRAFGFDTPGPAATQLQHPEEIDGPSASGPGPVEAKKQKRKSEGKSSQTSPKKKKVKV